MQRITTFGFALPALPLAVGYGASVWSLIEQDLPVLALLLVTLLLGVLWRWACARRAAACTCPVLRHARQVVVFHHLHCPNRRA